LNLIKYPNIADSGSKNVLASLELFDVILLGWNRVFPQNQEKLYYSMFLVVKKPL
jgi:hypothetical protein